MGQKCNMGLGRSTQNTGISLPRSKNNKKEKNQQQNQTIEKNADRKKIKLETFFAFSYSFSSF